MTPGEMADAILADPWTASSDLGIAAAAMLREAERLLRIAVPDEGVIKHEGNVNARRAARIAWYDAQCAWLEGRTP